MQRQDVFSGEWEEKRRFNIDLLKKDRNVDGLIEAMRSEDALTRQRAALVLGEMDEKKAVQPLIRTLGDPVQAVREAAADSLAMVGRTAVEPLIEILTHPERLEKEEELREEQAELLGGGEEEPEDITVTAGRTGPSWTIQTSRDLRRVYAAAILGEIGDERAMEPLVRALKDGNVDVRCQASGALTKMGKGAVGPLTDMLRDSDHEIRVVAAGMLGDIGDSRAVDPLIGALYDDTDDVRGAAAGALVQIGDAAVDRLIEVTKDEDRWVRLYAAGALKYIGEARAIDALEELVRDEDPDVRSVAEDAIEKIRMIRGEQTPEPSPPTSR